MVDGKREKKSKKAKRETSNFTIYEMEHIKSNTVKMCQDRLKFRSLGGLFKYKWSLKQASPKTIVICEVLFWSYITKTQSYLRISSMNTSLQVKQ